MNESPPKTPSQTATRPLTEADPVVPSVEGATNPAPPPAFDGREDDLRGPSTPGDTFSPSTGEGTRGDEATSFRNSYGSYASDYQRRGYGEQDSSSFDAQTIRELAETWIRANREAALLGSFAVGVVVGVLLRR